jgi:ATP synthase protein I
MNLKNNQNQKKPLSSYAKYSTLGFQMVAIIGGGCFGGVKLDEYLKTTNQIFTISLSLVSIFIALYVVLKDIIKNGP